ncbi:MAG: DUF362 domain-containing protein [Clostridiales Family XIII bacterium]|jgi:uncharacterized protein (DUF362 family)|nr:DUF362 domain-containing protein [Clostridiales Family XIII bacterium]
MYDLLNDENVYIEKRDVYSYPSGEHHFSPSEAYPEYRLGDLSPESNPVYDMVRAAFHGMGLDDERYGTPQWNPLGDLIKSGDNVVIKPNLVMHVHRGNAALGLDSVITHPSIVRAVTDYCLIALEGAGKLTIGDAPLQTCDWASLVDGHGYTALIAYYDSKGQSVNLIDFRLMHATRKAVAGINVLTNVENSKGDDRGYAAVNIGKYSMHMEKISNYEKLRVTNYDPSKMKEHHNPNKNEYLIPRTILEADVIINCPKPKTHRKAGVTSAMKNLVGINGHKDWLPHHTKGSKAEHGDEYEHASWVKRMGTYAIEKADLASLHNKAALSLFWGYVYRALLVLARKTVKDKFEEGSWYGNDTIWRTICDLNRILLYADKEGIIKKEMQRKCLQVGDLIVSGDKDGPMAPRPKEVGVIATALNPAAFDTTICALMGMDQKKIPSISGAYGIDQYPIAAFSPADVRMISNAEAYNGKAPSAISRARSFGYEATSGWEGHIEAD